jgi:magnesium-transporting ATPase (P-type)
MIPWEFEEEEVSEFSLAVTGKAFNFLLSSPKMEYVLQEVLMLGQVFARMSPEDKAKLV